MTAEFGSGFPANNLWRKKDFYLRFPILDAVRQELTWTHYKFLVRQPESKKGEFYRAHSKLSHLEIVQVSPFGRHDGGI